MKKVLLIEDDLNLGESLKRTLECEGMEVSLKTSLKQAREEPEENIEIVILDWMLPDGQGIDYLREIRAQGLRVPVIMLTARAELIDKVLGLEAGANDYITKPFEPRELVARVRVQLRDKAFVKDSDEIIKVGELELNEHKREVTWAGQKVELTKMEFDLLRLLADGVGNVFSRDEILNKVWGYENFPTTRTVDTHILQLRQKLSDSLIETVRGIGYRMKQPE